jgi:hypothetical protein
VRHRKPHRRNAAPLAGVLELVEHPAALGVAVGIANGVLAAVREKPMSVTANLVTAAVVGISEAVLVPDESRRVSVGLLSAIGAAAGMAAFTRFDPKKRAILESSSTAIGEY